MLGAIILQVVLIFLNAIFASAEIAVISMNDTKLENMARKGNKKAKKLVDLTAQPARFLATIQVAITLAGFLGSAYAADNFAEPLVKKLVEMGVSASPAVLNSVCVFVITIIIAYFEHRLRRTDSEADRDEQNRTDCIVSFRCFVRRVSCV